MLKKISFFLIVIFGAFVLSSNAQITYNMPLNDDGKIEYKKVVEEKGDAQTLYSRALEWITSNIRNLAIKVTLLDEDNKTIEAYRRFNIEFDIEKEVKGLGGLKSKTEVKSYKAMVRFDFKIEFKENRYRIILDNFRMASDSGIPIEQHFDDDNEEKKEYYIKFFEAVDAEAKNFIETVENGLKKEEEVEDSW